MLKEVPLYNDVMLPSTSEKLPLPMSPLAPSDPSPDLVKMEPRGEEFSFSSTSHHVSDTANTPSISASSSEVDTWLIIIEAYSDVIMIEKEFWCCDIESVFPLPPCSPAVQQITSMWIQILAPNLNWIWLRKCLLLTQKPTPTLTQM